MRHDMAKVIVERPRIGGGVQYPRAARRSDSRRPIEEGPRRESMKEPWLHEGRGQKFLNENLAPLRRYLRSQVGRPWDKVYGEICERIDRDSAVQLHIWQHLMQYVCTNPSIITGEVAHGGGAFGLSRRYAFYVDPRCGLLRVNLQYFERWHQPRLESTNRVEVDDAHCLEQLNGIWFELRLAPEPERPGRVHDHACRGEILVGGPDFRCYRGRRVYVAGKRQLGKRELRRFGLANAPMSADAW